MKTLLITFYAAIVLSYSHASLGGFAISIEFVEELPKGSLRTELTFEVNAIELSGGGEWSRTLPSYLFEGKVIKSDDSDRFKEEDIFLGAFDTSYEEIEKPDSPPIGIGDVLSVEVYKEYPEYDIYKFRITKHKRSNQAVDTTAANARLFYYANSKSTNPDVGAMTEAAVVSP